MKKNHVFAGLILGLGVFTTALAESPGSIGWIETVQIYPQDLNFIAKIDTGADNSSIHARNIELFQQHGERWVRFSLENKEGKEAILALPVIRIANIKRKRAEPIQRPVVQMELCLGNRLKTTHVNLANRENFKYRMLIGRSFLKDTYLVNSSKKYTVEPECKSDTLSKL